MTQSIPDDDDRQESLAELIERLRRTPPRRGMRHKTFAELAAEQGVGPIDIEDLMSKSPGPFYEGFEEDVRRIRRGELPIGPRK
jgi:hypothetical protein